MFYISADLKLRWVRGREVVTPVISFEFESLRYNDVSILFLATTFIFFPRVEGGGEIARSSLSLGGFTFHGFLKCSNLKY